MQRAREFSHRPAQAMMSLVVALLAVACQQQQSISITPATPVASCSRAVVLTPEDSVMHGLTATTVAVLQKNGICTYDIPEYNDEQRLGSGAREYGPISRAYAHPWGRNFTDHTAFDGGWLLLSMIYVESGAIPASYKSLSLVSGFNCLYVQHKHWPFSIKTWWEVAVGPTVSSNVCAGGTVTIVQTTAEQPSTNADDYPVAARFMEGPNRKPTLGIRCGNVWCVAGANGSSDIVPPAFDGLSGVGTTSRWQVKGWFDDQMLALTSGGVLLPSVRLSVVPTEGLGTYTVDNFKTPEGIQVATILVPKGAALGKYGNLGTGGYGLVEGSNTIFLRANDTGAGLVWKARVVNSKFPGGHEYTRDVLRTDHSALGFTIDGTARWHWKDTDEELWIRCDVGCCLVYGDA